MSMKRSADGWGGSETNVEVRASVVQTVWLADAMAIGNQAFAASRYVPAR